MQKISLAFWKSELLYAYKPCAYKKEHVSDLFSLMFRLTAAGNHNEQFRC